jgi:chromosome segregation ATPase
MFNLFPKKKSVDEILEDSKPKINITAEWNELLKEVLQLRPLKEENEKLKAFQKGYIHERDTAREINAKLLKEKEDLSNRVNEIDSDVNRDLQDQLFTLKNDYALLRSKNNTLQEFIDTKIKVDWKSARIDILERDLQKCAEQRDEYKHQLNAANKEIEALKSNLRDYQDRLAESFSYSDMKKLQNIIDELKNENEKLKKDIVDYVLEKDDEIEKLKAQKHPMYPLHWIGLDPLIYEQAKDLTIEETIDKVKKKTPWVEEPVDWKGETTEKPWKCPCNKCKEIKKGTSWEEAASDLALRVVKLEKQIKELTLIKLCQKPS